MFSAVLFAWLLLPTSVQPADGELKILAQGSWPYVPIHTGAAGPKGRVLLAVRSVAELAEAAGANALPAVAKKLGVATIDFDKHMLVIAADYSQPMVGVSGGPPPSAMFRTEIPQLILDEGGKVLHVCWRFAPRDPATEVLTAPVAVVLLPKFDGKINFVRLATPGGKGPPGEAEAAAKAPPGKEVKILANALWPDGWKGEMPAQQWIVRTYAELIPPGLAAPENVLEMFRQQNAAKYAKALKVDAVDFQKQMIIGVSGGVQPTGSYRVEITRLEKKGNGLTVFWKLHAPAPGDLVAQAQSHPAAVVLVEQTPGPVQFKQVQK